MHAERSAVKMNLKSELSDTNLALKNVSATDCRIFLKFVFFWFLTGPRKSTYFEIQDTWTVAKSLILKSL